MKTNRTNPILIWTIVIITLFNFIYGLIDDNYSAAMGWASSLLWYVCWKIEEYTER